MNVDGPLIRRLREDDDWKGTTFAREVGISPQYLSDIERGRRGAPVKLVKKMAKVLDIPFRSLTMAAKADVSDDDAETEAEVAS